MTEAARNLLVAFESLPAEDRRAVAAEILRRATVEEDYEGTDDDLIQAADRAFLELERSEARTEATEIQRVLEETLRQRRLEMVLDHAGRVELGLDQEALRRLREKG
ncbi:MAG TPA: hypothetical protein VJG13_07140 [Thermoanaerobaculia bacterium]|jgi:hypothetical protein|nr:hypothetical protein [Thermoanaerobaculia bacterium]